MHLQLLELDEGAKRWHCPGGSFVQLVTQLSDSSLKDARLIHGANSRGADCADGAAHVSGICVGGGSQEAADIRRGNEPRKFHLLNHRELERLTIWTLAGSS